MAVYDVSDFERHQWRYQQLVNPAYHKTIKVGAERYERFEPFSGEVFHRMICPEPRRRTHCDPGTEVFVTFHDAVDAIPEVTDLKEQCVGDEHLAAIATDAILSEILAGVAPPDALIRSAEDDQILIEQLTLMLDRVSDDEESAALVRDSIEAASIDCAEKAHAAAQAANMIDQTDLRASVRKGAKAACERIQALVSAGDAFSVGGNAMHGGRQMRIAASRQVADRVAKDKRLAAIANLAGRMRRIAVEEQHRKVRHGNDEYCGIIPDADLSRIVPSELALLDDDLEGLFFAKLIERSLPTFDVHAREVEQRGPVVFLLDSSASMDGSPSIWASAVALAFLRIAIDQKRSFALVHFGDRVLRKDFFPRSKEHDPATVLDAVSFFASDGGTNFTQPIADAIQIIRDDGEFKKADIVMCTDGASHVPAEKRKEFLATKERLQFRFHTIVIGGGAQNASELAFISDTAFGANNLQDGGPETELRGLFRDV